jgi:hypothetical protein
VLPFLYGPLPRFAETGGPPQTHAEESEQKPAAKPDGTVTAPFFIRIPKTAKEEAEEAADRRDKSSTDRWLMIFTGAVALFTLLLVVATALLYQAGERQLHLSRETAQRQLRAYVHVKGAEVQNIGDPSKRRVIIIIENSGQTPAYEVRFRAGEHVREWPLKTEFGDFPDDLRTAIGPLGSNGTYIMPVPVSSLSAWEEEQLQGGKAGIYAWGDINYIDCFGKPQRTWFAYVCEGEGLPKGAMHLFGKENGAT